MKKENKYQGYPPEILDKLHKVQLEILEDFIRVCNKYGLRYFAIYGTAIGAVRHEGFIPWDDDIDVGMLRRDYDRFFEVFEKELGDKYNLLTPEIDPRYACTVTHIQRKGTRFVSEMSKDLKCEQCIFMDIFPFDYVAPGKKAQKKQARRTTFWGKLLFLSGTGNPIIPYGGIMGAVMHAACMLIHLVLKLFRVSPASIYRKYKAAATEYNNRKERSGYVTSFEYTGCIKDKVRRSALFPVREVPFENMMIAIPNNNDEFLTKVYGDYMQLPPEDKRVNHMPIEIDFGDVFENQTEKTDEQTADK